MGLEKLCKRYGLHKGRRMWEAHRRRMEIQRHLAAEQEKEAAAARYRQGPLVVKNDFDFMPTIHMSRFTYKEQFRSTLPQKGCTGGEALEDEEYKRDLIKRFPELGPQRKVTTGDIRSGWSAAIERAAVMGRMDRAMTHMRVNHILETAAKSAPPIIAV